MDEFQAFLGRGGYIAAIVAVAVALRYGSQAWRTWRRSGRDGQEVTMSDAATTNTMLLATLRDERAESRAKDQRIDQLEAEIGELRRQMFAQQREYETEISDLRDRLAETSRQMQGMTRQLDELQARIHQGGTQ